MRRNCSDNRTRLCPRRREAASLRDTAPLSETRTTGLPASPDGSRVKAAERHRRIDVAVERGNVDDDVIERAERRGLREPIGGIGAEQNLFAFDPLGRQQRGDERRVVLAVAEAARKDRARIIGNVASVAEIDSDIADVSRHPVEDRFRLRPHVGLVPGDLLGELLDRGRHRRLGLRLFVIGGRDRLMVRESGNAQRRNGKHEVRDVLLVGRLGVELSRPMTDDVVALPGFLVGESLLVMVDGERGRRVQRDVDGALGDARGFQHAPRVLSGT